MGPKKIMREARRLLQDAGIRCQVTGGGQKPIHIDLADGQRLTLSNTDAGSLVDVHRAIRRHQRGQ